MLLQQCPVKWIPHHVSDIKTTTCTFLDRWATPALEMDEDAKGAMKPLTSLATVNPQFKGNPGLVKRQKSCILYTLLLQ
jgi:hypothetical protein